MNKALEDRLSERKAFEALLIESAERALRKYARWTSGDENTIAKTALPSLDVLKVLVSGELAAASQASGARLRVDVPFTALIRQEVNGYGPKRSVDIALYDAATGAPIRLIQLLNAPTRELSGTSIVLSLLRGAFGSNLPDAFELLFTDGHATEQAANEVLADLVQTSMQGFEASRVIRLRDPSAPNDMFVGLTVARVLHAD
jgi:hypothetical protein